MEGEDHGWRPRIPDLDQVRPGRRLPPWPEGEDYFALMEKHGRPNGPFDKERKLPYRGSQ